jgi:hypothetical protein
MQRRGTRLACLRIESVRCDRGQNLPESRLLLNGLLVQIACVPSSPFACITALSSLRLSLAGRWRGLRGLLAACATELNDPYPMAERGQNIFYGAFTERPKHLDPVQSYSEDEATFLYQIVEPPLQYHYLKRPYVLEPATALEMPRAAPLWLATDVSCPPRQTRQVTQTVVEIRIRPGILYQPHPAFARHEEDGSPRYLGLSADDLRDVRGLGDFADTGTRELLAADYVHQIKRLAHPRLHSPIFELMAEYIPGLKTLHAQLLAAQQAASAGVAPSSILSASSCPASRWSTVSAIASPCRGPTRSSCTGCRCPSSARCRPRSIASLPSPAWPSAT